jgi:CRP-like cAMP-binding protein
MSENFWHLKGCNLFAQLSDERLRLLESRCRMRKFARNSPIYLPMDQANSVFLLVNGRAKICNLTPDGKQSILAFINPGELFGELALLGDDQRDEYAETLEASAVVMIPGEEMERLMHEIPHVSLGITKMIGKRIERRLRNLLFLSNRDRLTHLLLELAEEYGRRTNEGVELGVKLSHQELANVIGSTRETVTVVLGELQSEGLVKVGRRRIVLLNSKKLANNVLRDDPIPVDPNSNPTNSNSGPNNGPFFQRNGPVQFRVVE